MKKTIHTEPQILGILNEQEQGKKVVDICREHGISQPTFYQWKSKYGGMDLHQLKRVKELESEVSRYKRMFAELSFENHVLKDVISKKL
jgi:putative transposase